MHKAILAFSNGEKLEINEGQKIIPISRFCTEDDITVSQGIPYEVWYHASAGLIPSIAELLCKCDFFQLIENDDKVYKSSAVVTIENA